MAGKARVHELAKELGVTSKEVLARLSEQGEFVKSASSTVEAPVARRLRESFGGGKPAPEKAAGNGAGGAKASVKDAAPAPAKPAAPKPAAPPAPTPPAPPAPAAEAPEQPQAGSTGAQARPGPTPGPRPAAPKPAARTPRVGNNPFSSAQPVDRPIPRPQAPRPGAPRPGGASPGNMPPRPAGAGAVGQAARRVPVARHVPVVRDPALAVGPALRQAVAPAAVAAVTTAAAAVAAAASVPHPAAAAVASVAAPVVAAVAAGPASAAVLPVHSDVPAVRRDVAASRSGRNAPNTRTCRRRSSVVCGCRTATARRSAWHVVPRCPTLPRRSTPTRPSLVQALFNLGEMVTATQSVGDETLELLGSEMNYVVQVVSPEDEDRELLESFDLTYGEDEGTEEDLQTRPPVVTVMGHVDHGKTRLLDTIRNASVREGEAGGITQHIGAYQVTVDLDGDERPITFIDTPGHEAFTAMRARGAKATDIAILVVAADDGVMPQTVEAINHAQAADVPIVVAVNKIDKEGADPQKIRSQLTEYGLVAEDFGGETMFVDISAKAGTNIEALEEAVLLTADAALDLRANPDMEAQGVAIEAHLDRGRGPVATVLIQRGTLRVGDSIVAGDAYGRVRRMVDEHGDDIEEALPSRPVQVIGFTSVPGAGDNLLVVDEDRIARQIADRRSARKRNALAARSRKRISLEDLDAALKETSQLNLILKGDNSGTVEALEEALLGIEIDDEVELRVIDRGVGGVTETNVNLASASDAIIIGFNVRAEGKATELANREGVDIRYYSVIYQAIDEIQSALKGMLKPIYEENQLGRAEIRALFRSSKVGLIAGCLVTSGIVRRNAKARLLRDNIVVAENLTVSSLRREKDDVTEVRDGYECGLTLTYSDLKEGDVIETYELVEKERV